MMSNILDKYDSAFSDEEYAKAREFYEFLKDISGCNNGVLRIDREKFIKLAMVIMGFDNPYQAYIIIRKMIDNKMILTLKNDYVAIKLN